ncbi:acyltransferase family protein [Anaerosporobacter faecicola]|uniref:acyltransferase family protein n=1 Tax=Anaerosporobacter faecicola TaxID=2718714 RepID=UPI0014391F68|nr:acyltransferase family protein [Anaerosporobacter faecicola]
MRKYYIDNLRILCIFLLIPFHTTMIYNTLGETFYVNGTPKESLTFVNLGVYPWWMTGLFVLAGMSTMYAFERRTGKQYLQERIRKLLVPLLSCLVFVVPMQTYIADRFHNGYQGNYFEHLKIFLTITDWSGYDGHFTPAHTWFILYLFLISSVTLPLLLWYRNKKKKLDGTKINMAILICLGIPVVVLEDVLNVGGKSFAQFGACFLIGYFVLSDEHVLERLQKYSTPLGITWVALIGTRCFLHAKGYEDSIYFIILYSLLEWIGILAMLGLGRRFLNHNWKFTRHFVKAEFSLYLFHQTIVIMVGYWLIPYIKGVYAQYVLIIILSFIISYLLYQICRRFNVTRFLFAIKK